MTRLVSIIVIALLVLAAFPSAGLAANDTPERASLLSPQTTTYSDRLVGDLGGSVRFYKIEYAGNGQPVPIRVTSSPGRSVTGPRFGFKVYGPNGLVGEALVQHSEETWTRYALTLASSTPGEYLVQVYNFTDRVTIDFTIEASGLDVATVSEGAKPSAVLNTSPEHAVPLVDASEVTGGVLVGRHGGAFQYFTITYPGGGSELKVEMIYNPPSPFKNNAVGFNLWGIGDQRLATGAETHRDGKSVTLSAVYSAPAGQVLQLQVLNYEPGLAVSYTLLVTGTGGPLVQAEGNDTPERAFVLSTRPLAVRGVLPAGQEASFDYYLLKHPGEKKSITLSISTSENSSLSNRAVGFNIYEGSALKSTVYSSLSADGRTRVAHHSVYAENATTYGIQVFNWSRTSPVDYVLFVYEAD